MTIEEIIEQLDGIVGTYEILIGNGVNSDILDVDDIEAIREAISALSENKGEWLVVVDSYYENGTIKEKHWECSKCGCGKSGWGEYKFCPECGADMRAESIDPNDLTHMFDGVTEIPKDAFKGWTTEKLLEQIRKENNDNPEDTGCDHND